MVRVRKKKSMGHVSLRRLSIGFVVVTIMAAISIVPIHRPMEIKLVSSESQVKGSPTDTEEVQALLPTTNIANVGENEEEKEVHEPPNRDLYRDWSFFYINHHFHCHNRIEWPIMPESAWTDARELYASHLSRRNKEGSSTPPLLPDPKENGFSVPMEVRKSPGKGRGIFAMRDIRKGELVWSAKQTARFADGNDFRDFIFSLDKTYVCDFLNISYLQSLTQTSAMESKNDSAAEDATTADVPESTQVFISVDLDEGGLCNDRSVGYEDESNVGCDNIMADGHEGGCERNMFALRDIKADEEFICNYSGFLAKKGWKYFGL